MQLFKRVLLSLFPDEIITQNVNPASMFISFISTKEFFSVIHRKIVENYKLNLFDIALDSFEFKVGFGDKPSLKQKNTDLYYGYCSTANLNGYRFMNPANLANSVALLTSVYLKDSFEKYDPDYFIHFLYAVYLMSFVFLWRTKIFPQWDEESTFNWFVELFFNFYTYVYQQTDKKIDKEIFLILKKELLGNVDVFFMLFQFYKKLNGLFENDDFSKEEFYGRLFDDELNKKSHKLIISDFIDNADKYTSSSKFSIGEKKIFPLLFPADILLRYLFMDEEVFHIVDYVISKIFDMKEVDPLVKSFRNGDAKIEEFLMYISDHKHFKKNFFSWLQKYVVTVFREMEETENVEIIEEQNEELDELMSSIWDDIENFKTFKVPERIKRESKLMEKILNFYVTFLGWFWTWRGDSFYLRLFKKPLIDKMLASVSPYDDRPKTVNYYGALLYQYGKNIFYYTYATDNVRAGKQKFFIPHKSTYKKVYSNMCVLRLMDENFLITLLQDLNPKDLRIYVKNKKILDLFKLKFSDSISALLKQNKKVLIKEVYSELNNSLEDLHNFSDILTWFVSKSDLFYLKESMYSLDFWVTKIFYTKLHEFGIDFKKLYSDLSILWIFATIKESLFGFMLYYQYVNDLTLRECKKSNKNTSKNKKVTPKDYRADLLLLIYLRDVLQIGIEHEHTFKALLYTIIEEFSAILREWVFLDDNKDFMAIVLENWYGFVDQKTEAELWPQLSGEDIVWFRGVLKNITYYNKRFLIPK